MDLSDPDSLLRRVRWPNVARLAALVVLAVLAALVPHLSGGSPVVPTGVAVPVGDVARQRPLIAPAAPKPKVAPKAPEATPVHRKRAHRHRPPRPPRHPRHARRTATPTRRIVHAQLAPAPAVGPSTSYDSTTEFNPAAREFG